MLGLQVAAPGNRVLEMTHRSFPGWTLPRCSSPGKVGIPDALQPVDQALVHKLVQEIHFSGASVRTASIRYFTMSSCRSISSARVAKAISA